MSSGSSVFPDANINAGHDLRRPRHARRICHAMALDESRVFFPLTRLSRDGVADPRAGRSVVSRRAFGHRRRQQQSEPELDCPSLDVSGSDPSRTADRPGRGGRESGDARRSDADQRSQARSRSPARHSRHRPSARDRQTGTGCWPDARTTIPPSRSAASTMRGVIT